MFEVRKDEPGYAKLFDPSSDDKNRYGSDIQLIPSHEEPVSLRINHDEGIGCNPNRNKQHGFYFNADNCIGCHACESACSEKNDLPAHFAFRSVGYVEGGEFPDFTRMNISMACNHCDNPVCLKGCPTRAYTKHPEYGAVIQDPEICFGCGYCTWVCPYNAPQLDPVKGRVEKCNMCVDRLEVGLKPACVSACVGNALDFGVIENVPDNREDTDTTIPGFPTPDITHPNIRFQQQKEMPNEVTRTDSMQIKYRQDDEGQYLPEVDEKEGLERHWNFSRLSSSENPLVAFTLAVQSALGIFCILTVGSWFGIDALESAAASPIYAVMVILSLALAAFGLLMSVTHLGKPFRFYRGFNNWRHSPVCREGLGITGFLAFGGLHLLTQLPSHAWMPDFVLNLFGIHQDMAVNIAKLGHPTALLTMTSGAIGLYYMYRCYRIPARPFWDHISTASHFVGNALALGAVVICFVCAAFVDDISSLIATTALIAFVGILLEGLGLCQQAKQYKTAKHEGAVSHYIQRTTFGYTYLMRNILIAVNALIAASLATMAWPLAIQITGLVLLTAGIVTTAVIGRCLFYILVIPTTMPGAFFWKNKGFVEHARDIGMDHMPNSGVVPARH